MAYNINPLAPYRYKEQNVLVPIQFGAEVTISPEDKIISVTADGSLLGTVALDVDKGVLSLVGKDGQPFSSVEIPTVSGFDDAKFNEETLELTITVELSDGTKKEVVIPFKDMLDGYATVEDVQENTEDIKKNAADIATVNENLVSAIENINNVVLPKIVGDINQSIMNETDARLKADAALDEAIKKNASDVATVNSNLVSSVEVLNKNMADGFNTINGGINNEIRPAISGNTERIVALEESDNKSVKWTDVSTAENPGRKSIILGNHDTILGATTSGGAVNVAMVSKWDKVDLGSVQVEINLNGSADHPTYNDTEELAFVSDVQAAHEKVAEETAAREAADNALSGRVDAVVQSVADEAIARENKDTEIEGKLAGKADASALEQESADRKSTDEALSGRVDTVESKVKNKVDWTDVSTGENPGRKSIILGNHDTILGTTTSGGSVNVAMVSKWDKVDLGSAQVEINLNGSADHPTYNDTEELAFVSDVQAAHEKVAEETAAREAADNALSGRVDAVVQSVADEAIARENKDTEIEGKLAGKADASALEQESADRKSTDEALSGRVDTVESKVKNKVDWTDVSTGENPGRKSIILGNHDTILGTTTSGGSVNVAMVSKWDKVDLGSAQVEINLNGSADHPTYNDTEELAFLSDVQAAHEDVAEEAAAREAADNALSGRVDAVESKVENKVDWTDVSTEENPNRKAVVLGNHDTLLGTTTSGGSVNVAMVSKWDKVDLGSAQVELNLNGSATRPTYNDDQQLALMSDVVSGLDSIELVQRSGETESHIYDLMVNGESVGTINVPFDKFIKSVEYVESSHSLNIVFVTEDGEQPTPVNLSGLVDVYSAGNGLALADGTFSIKIDEASDSYLTLSESGLKLSGVADALALKMDKVNMPSNVVSVLGDVVSEADAVKLQYTGLEYNVQNGAYGEGVAKEVSIPMASQEKAGVMSSADKVKLDSLTPDVYEINLANLLSAEDSESISTAIGGWDNLVAVPSKNQVIVGLLGNGSVSVSLRKVGNTVSLFYIVDAIGMGYTVNEVNITNASNELSKSVNTHAVLTEDMVVDTLNSDEATLPLSAKQGKVLDEKTRVIAVPIRTGLNKAYTQEEILGWFGVSDIPSLKKLISAKCVFVLSYGILLTGNPMYYKIPVNYIAFESANQIKIVAVGLDTSNDKPVRYTILINLDGTLITEKSNISLVMENLVFESELPVSEVRIDATEILEADDTTVDQSLTDDTLFETLSNAIAVHQDVILYDQDEQVKAISLKHTTATEDGTIDEIIMHYYNGDGFVRVAIKETASETYVFEKDTLTLA